MMERNDVIPKMDRHFQARPRPVTLGLYPAWLVWNVLISGPSLAHMGRVYRPPGLRRPLITMPNAGDWNAELIMRERRMTGMSDAGMLNRCLFVGDILPQGRGNRGRWMRRDQRHSWLGHSSNSTTVQPVFLTWNAQLRNVNIGHYIVYTSKYYARKAIEKQIDCILA